MIGLDFETTDVDTETARIVTGTLIVVEPGIEPVKHSWLVDPGIEIPEATTAIHGISTERARAEGMSPVEMLGQLTELLTAHWTPDVPLVAYNASYDLTLYDRELSRHRDGERLSMATRFVVDPLVTDRHVDRYRKGGRKLADTCRHYEVELIDAHTSDADTLATLRLAFKLAARYQRQVGLVPLPALHKAQREWNHQWCMRMATFLRKSATRLEGLWPPAERGNNEALRLVKEHLAKSDITDEPTGELVATAVAQTRAKANDFASGADCWPMRPSVALNRSATGG